MRARSALPAWKRARHAVSSPESSVRHFEGLSREWEDSIRAMYDFDVVCIGSGPASQRASVQAAKLGS